MPKSGHVLEPLIRNLTQRAVLDDDDVQAILALPYTLRTLEPGAYTVREADPPTMCAVLLSGFAYRQKIGGDGARQIVAINIAGEALDFQNIHLDVADHSVQMLTRGQVAWVARADFQAIARARPNVGHAILVKILVEAAIAREWIFNVGRRDARSRAAHLLCELAVRLDAEGLAGEYGYELPMTQEQLGDALGLTSVHVNRTLKSLEADGLIVRSKRSVQFPDWQKLRRVADFNTRYLHLEQQHA